MVEIHHIQYQQSNTKMHRIDYKNKNAGARVQLILVARVGNTQYIIIIILSPSLNFQIHYMNI